MNNRFKVLLRILRKDKIFSFITIGGLAISLSLSLLLSSYIFNEYSYDNDIPNIKSIYRLCAEKGIITVDGAWKTNFEQKYPEIEYACRYDNVPREIIVEEEPHSIDYLVKTDNEFFDLFSVDLLFGNSETPLPTQSSIAISSSLANIIFGEENPVGKTVNIGHTKDFTVSAVFNDLYEKSSVQAQAIIRWENVKALGGEARNKVYHSRLFLKLYETANTSGLEQKISSDYSELHFAKQPFVLLPHKNSYMSGLTESRQAATLHANLNSIRLFSVVTFLILLISILNFVILFISNHLSRLKEIGLKKTIGAGRAEIFKQFLFEAVTVCLIAFLLAIALSVLFEPIFSILIQKTIPVNNIFQIPFILYVFFGVVLIGSIAGLYPALIVSRLKPISILGSKTKISRLRIKSGLSVIQYAISIILIISVIVMTRQNNFTKNRDVGFNTEQLICIKTNWQMKDKIPLLKERLLAQSNISSCTASGGIPGKTNLWGVWKEARDKYKYDGNVPHFAVDPDFFKVFDVQLVEGRAFQEEDWHKSVIVSEKVLELTGWESIDGKFLNDFHRPFIANDNPNNHLKVVGVINNFSTEKYLHEIGPTVIECSDNFGINYLTCKLESDNYSQVVVDIQKIWQELNPEYIFDYHFYDTWFDSRFKQEQHSAYVTKIFAILAIIISCMGTFGIIYFVSKQRTKEIGIRKTNGAKVVDIIKILNWNFLKWIGIAIVLSIPISYLIMLKYLESFAYKTTLSWWIFALAGALALGIALLTVSWQSWRAATRNPVEALRYE